MIERERSQTHSCYLVIKQDETELRSQVIEVITDRKSYMDFLFVQKSMNLNDLERSKCICNHR